MENVIHLLLAAVMLLLVLRVEVLRRLHRKIAASRVDAKTMAIQSNCEILIRSRGDGSFQLIGRWPDTECNADAVVVIDPASFTVAQVFRIMDASRQLAEESGKVSETQGE
jgi:hypothetical protein